MNKHLNAITKMKMTPKILILCFGIWGLMGTSFAWAQNLPDARTLAYFNSEPHKQMITTLGIVYDETIFDRKSVCQTGYKWTSISFALLQPLTFVNSQSHPQSGIWTYRFKFERCEESVIYNAMFQGQDGKLPRLTRLVPGMSRADPRLMVDLMMPLVLSGDMAGVPSDCKNFKVVNTEVTEEPFELRVDGQVYPGTWQELWSANACGKAFKAEFCLVPQPKAGTNWKVGKCQR